MHTDDACKTAFVTPDDYQEFKRVPFGLTNAPSHFQRCMQSVLAPALHAGTLVYIDDILIFANDEEEFFERLELVLQCLDNADLRLNAKKCVIGASELTVVGFRISQDGKSVDSARMKALLDVPEPQNTSGIRRVLGMFQYVAEMIPDCQRVMEPLYRLTRGADEPTVWTNEHREALDLLKRRLQDGHVLAPPDPSRPWHLYTDASDIGVGGVLVQEDEHGSNRPVAFFSKLFNATQRRWCTYDKELYGILHALTRPDMEPLFKMASSLHVHTDHQNIVYLMRRATVSPKVMRWRIALQDFNLQIQHVPGEENVIADMMSREFPASELNSLREEIPEEEQAILDSIHGGTAGHNRIATMRRLAGPQWPRVRKYAPLWVEDCPTCRKLDDLPTKSPTPWRSIQRVRPWETLQVDTIGPLPESNGCRFIVVIVDCFTKYVSLHPTVSTTAAEAARALI